MVLHLGRALLSLFRESGIGGEHHWEVGNFFLTGGNSCVIISDFLIMIRHC